MKSLFSGFVLAICVLCSGSEAAAARDWGSLYGYVAWTNDYRFYGVSSSNRQPAVQGGLHWAMPDNFYAGIFVSTVRFRDYRNTSFETDFYGGRHVYFDGNDLNLEVLFSAFPNTAGHPSYAAPGVIYPTYNFVEPSAELSHAFGSLTLSGKAMWSPHYSSRTGQLWAVNSTASYDINKWLKLSASWGHQWVAHGTDRSHWDVGATATWRQQWVADLRYYGTDIGRTHCYTTNWCEAAVVVKLTYQFAIL